MEVLIPTPRIDKIAQRDWMKPKTQALEYIQIEFCQLIENHIWITACKKKIPVSKMSTSHIHNCIRCLYGKGKSKIPAGYLGGKDKWIKIFNEELLRRQ